MAIRPSKTCGAPAVGDRARALDAAAVPDRALLDQGRHERGGRRGHPQRLHRGDAAPHARGEHPQRGRRLAEPRLPGDHAVVPDLPRALERGVRGRRSRSSRRRRSRRSCRSSGRASTTGCPRTTTSRRSASSTRRSRRRSSGSAAELGEARALLRRPRAAGHRRALLRRQRPDHRRHRPRVGARARSRRSSSRARACSTRRSGTATATCSIPSARRSRTTSASTSSTSAAATSSATRRSRARPARRSRSTGTRVWQHAPEPAHGRLPRRQPDPRADGGVQPRVHGCPPPAARVLQRQPAPARGRDRA